MGCGCGSKHYIVVDENGDCVLTDDDDDCIVFTSAGVASREGRTAGLDAGWSVLKVPKPEGA